MSTTNSKPDVEQHPRYIIPLRECTGDTMNRIGAKAANLAKLLQTGFPVPDGFVVTANAFQEVIANITANSNSLEKAIQTLPPPPGIKNELMAALTSLGDTSVAVRSSGIAEDLPGASFAGQYETILGVRGSEAVMKAVQRCWASAFNRRVTAYQDKQGINGIPRMAVLVQQLVAAEAAGVAFTANPLTGDRTETIVSAVRGLGDRLVSGQVTPEEWSVKNGKAICTRFGEKALDPQGAKKVADMARQVEKYLGGPQDIEWAQTKGKFYLLQARPITTLVNDDKPPIGITIAPPPGFWEREVSHFPRPVSPMFQYLFVPIVNASLKSYGDEVSGLLETIIMKEIGGWMYRRLVPMGGKDRPAPPTWLWWIMVHFYPVLRSRIKNNVRVIRSDIVGSYVERWYKEWKPKLIARIKELRSVQPATLDDPALDKYLLTVIDFLKESTQIHFYLDLPVIEMIAELEYTCHVLLGWDERRTMDLLSGLSEKSSEPSRQLAQLAALARSPAVSHLLEHIDDQTMGLLAGADKTFAEAFLAYQEEFGCRALNYEFAEPTLAEMPELILGLIRDHISRGYDPAVDILMLEQKRVVTQSEARTALLTRSKADQERFERDLARAERAYPLREDNEFYSQSCPFALVRYALLELGNRLKQRGQITDTKDIFFLKLEEAQIALQTHKSQKAVVTTRKAQKAWVEAHPGPISYGKSFKLPSLTILPPETRHSMEISLWSYDHVYAHPADQKGEQGTLHGIAASAGQYTGPARVVMNESEFNKVHNGDVLICPITSPVWSVLFPSVGALVTDAGGILCHSAIIAREYRVPAVVATGNATSTICDNQQVTVDGSAGLVKVAL